MRLDVTFVPCFDSHSDPGTVENCNFCDFGGMFGLWMIEDYIELASGLSYFLSVLHKYCHLASLWCLVAGRMMQVTNKAVQYPSSVSDQKAALTCGKPSS